MMEKQYYQTKITELIEYGYDLFAQYHLVPQQKLDICNCGGCATDQEHQYLLNRPLHELDSGIFTLYVNSAYSDGKTPLNEFRYFLPLFLDLMVKDEKHWISEDYFFGRVGAATLEQWLPEEIDFLQQFSECYINLQLFDEEDAEIKYVEDFLEMFQSYLFDTEKLATLCLNHSSALCLINYATNIVNQGYDEYEKVDELELVSKRVGKILTNWKYDPTIKKHFTEQYSKFINKGYLFNHGNEYWVKVWIEGVEQGLY